MLIVVVAAVRIRQTSTCLGKRRKKADHGRLIQQGDIIFASVRAPEVNHSDSSNRFGVVIEKFVSNFKARRVQLVNGDVHAKRHGQRLQL